MRRWDGQGRGQQLLRVRAADALSKAEGQQEQPAVMQNPPGPPVAHMPQAPSPKPADKLPCTLVLPVPAIPNGIRKVNPAFPGPERVRTVLEQG